MSVELRPLGVTCNIRCSYCYQNPQRDAGNLGRRYDLEAMKAATAEVGGPFTLFGGEPLLVPLPDLEELWAWGFETYGGSSMQTNGTLITDEHIDRFRRYAVRVGISADGPEDLNDERRAGSSAQTAARTRATHRAIERLCAEGMPPSIIVTLHRTNAAADQLPRMTEWFRHLDRLGVRRVRLHVLEWEESTPDPSLMLTADENAAALLHFARLERELANVRFDLISEMRAMLLARDDEASCVWHACDPYTTASVQGVEGYGQRSNCGRTNKDGVDFVKAAAAGHERQVALFHTPQEHLGCQGCRFFLVCKGNCPGTASRSDWRNRSEHCALWKRLFEHLESELLAEGETPLSLHPMREAMERELVTLWTRGEDESLGTVLARLERDGVPAAPATLPGPSLPAFCRVSWVSDAARQVWAPRFEDVRRAWREVAMRSVADRVRTSAVIDVPPEELDTFGSAAAQLGLCGFVVGATVPSPDRGAAELIVFRVAVCRSEDERAVRQAWSSAAAAARAQLQGIPACCAGDANPSGEMDWEMNVLLAPLGLRVLPHTPCSRDCAASRELARRLVTTGEAFAPQETAWLREILSWPMRGSALHGLWELKTPVLKLVSDAEWTAEARVVTQAGALFPAEGARGVRFPFNTARSHRSRIATQT